MPLRQFPAKKVRNISRKIPIYIISIVLITVLLLVSIKIPFYIISDIYANSGNNYFQQGDFDSAKSNYASAISLVQTNEEYYYKYALSLCKLALASKETSEAFSLLKEAKVSLILADKLNPLDGKISYKLGEIIWWLSKFPNNPAKSSDAEYQFLKALETEPFNPEFLFGIIHYYLYSSNPAESYNFLRSLGSAVPRKRILYQLRKRPNWNDSLENEFIKGAEESINNPLLRKSALTLLEFINAENENWGKAKSFAYEQIDYFGKQDSVRVYLNLGLYALKEKDFAQANKNYQYAILNGKNKTRTLRNALRHYKIENAIEMYIQLCNDLSIKDESISSSNKYTLGLAYYRNKEPDKAKGILIENTNRNDAPLVHRLLAKIALDQKDWDTAELESHKATVLNPLNTHGFYLFSQALRNQKKYKASLEAIDKAIELSSKPRIYYFNFRAWINWNLKDYNSAIADWEKVLKMNPKNHQAAKMISEAYKKLNDGEMAIKFLLKSEEIKSMNSIN